MLDSYGRNISYLRLSLTERCQLRCSYCSKSDGKQCLKDRELDKDSLIFAAEIFGGLGFDKIRLTGGEPLLRRDILEIVSGIKRLNVYKDIAMTTNGVMLFDLAEELKKAGLDRVNISLDSLDNETYKAVTGSSLDKTLCGIEKAIGTFKKVKLNVVIIKGVNDASTESFISFARENPVDVRFIELMPLGNSGVGVKNDEILRSFSFLKPCKAESFSEPARYYTSDGFRGRVGFISPMSAKFCLFCNRMRLTSDGKLRLCLGNNLEISIAEELKSKNGDRAKEIIISAILKKPKEGFEKDFVTERKMNRIGG